MADAVPHRDRRRTCRPVRDAPRGAAEAGAARPGRPPAGLPAPVPEERHRLGVQDLPGGRNLRFVPRVLLPVRPRRPRRRLLPRPGRRVLRLRRPGRYVAFCLFLFLVGGFARVKDFFNSSIFFGAPLEEGRVIGLFPSFPHPLDCFLPSFSNWFPLSIKNNMQLGTPRASVLITVRMRPSRPIPRNPRPPLLITISKTRSSQLPAPCRSRSSTVSAVSSLPAWIGWSPR